MTWHFWVLCCRVDFHEAPIEPARACTDPLMARPLLHSGPSDFGKLGSIASLERPEQCTPRSTMDRPAENGQDEWLNNCVFRGKTRGTFLELGAFDGQFGSNSLMVEKDLCWRGVCVEAFELNYKKLHASRGKRCETVHGAICAKPGVLQFMQVRSLPSKACACQSGWGCAGARPGNLERVGDRDVGVAPQPDRAAATTEEGHACDRQHHLLHDREPARAVWA